MVVNMNVPVVQKQKINLFYLILEAQQTYHMIRGISKKFTIVIVVLVVMLIGVQVANYIGPEKLEYTYRYLEDIQPFDLIDALDEIYPELKSVKHTRIPSARSEDEQYNRRSFINRRGSTKNTRRVSETLKKIIAHQQNYTCATCRSMLPPSYQVDHIVPLYVDVNATNTEYLNSPANLQALCPNCHTMKTQHDSIRYKEYLR